MKHIPTSIFTCVESTGLAKRTERRKTKAKQMLRYKMVLVCSYHLGRSNGGCEDDDDDDEEK